MAFLRTHRPMVRTSGVALLVAGSLIAAACGGDDGGSDGDGASGSAACPVDALKSAKGTVNVDVWYAFQGLPAQAIQNLADKYNASQSKVKVTVANQGNYDEQLSKYKTGLGKPSTLPEVVTAEDTNTRFLIDSKSVVSAADCVKADPDAATMYDDLVPAVKAAYSLDGKLVPAGFAVSTPMLYFNKRHFAAAGLDIAKPPTTLEELRAAAEKIKAANIPGVAKPLVLKMDAWYIEHWLTGEAKPVVDQDNGHAAPATKTLIGDASGAELFQWIRKMVDDGLLNAVASSDDISPYLAVATESGSMLIETSAAITTIDAAISGTLNADILPQAANMDLSTFKFDTLDVGVAPTPGVKKAGVGQIGGNAWYIVKKTPEEIAAAWDFMKFVNQVDTQVEWTMLGGYLPSHEAVAEDPRLTTDWDSSRKGGWLKQAYASVLTLDPKFTGPWIGAYAGFRAEVRAALDKIGQQNGDPATVVPEAVTRIEKAFETYNKNPGQG
ncbi:MAG: extracellular solute-binding protein [Microthrixaceae bacterium]